ncbi:MAG: hypothetical protein ACK5S6_02145 [bacterium]|jgi:hypothetical protein
MKKPHGVPVTLSPEARSRIRQAVRDIIQEKGHRDYRFQEVAERTGYASGSIYRYIMSHADKTLRPHKKKKRKCTTMDKPQYVLEVEKHTGLTAAPYRVTDSGRPEWRLVSPTGVLLLILVGEQDVLQAVRAPTSLSSLQGITGLVREQRQDAKRKSRKTNTLDMETLVDNLWETEENE